MEESWKATSTICFLAFGSCSLAPDALGGRKNPDASHTNSPRPNSPMSGRSQFADSSARTTGLITQYDERRTKGLRLMGKIERLTNALLADRNRATDRGDVVACRVCGYSFRNRGRRGELNGNFCSMRCQDWYNAGNPAPSNPINYAVPIRDCVVIAGPPSLKIGFSSYGGIGIEMRPTSGGFTIRCASCRREFESKGLRCCSPECERCYRERQENLAVMAEVGIEPASKRRCANPECRARIPTWRKGRKVSSLTRFCSPKCARMARTAIDPVFVAETIK